MYSYIFLDPPFGSMHPSCFHCTCNCPVLLSTSIIHFPSLFMYYIYSFVHYGTKWKVFIFLSTELFHVFNYSFFILEYYRNHVIIYSVICICLRHFICFIYHFIMYFICDLLVKYYMKSRPQIASFDICLFFVLCDSVLEVPIKAPCAQYQSFLFACCWEEVMVFSSLSLGTL